MTGRSTVRMWQTWRWSELKESKGSAQLGRRVESMISKIDQAVQRLNRDFVSSSNGTLQRMQEEGSV